MRRCLDEIKAAKRKADEAEAAAKADKTSIKEVHQAGRMNPKAKAKEDPKHDVDNDSNDKDVNFQNRITQLEKQLKKTLDRENMKAMKAVILNVQEISKACVPVNIQKSNARSLFKFHGYPDEEFDKGFFFRAKVLCEPVTLSLPNPCYLIDNPEKTEQDLIRILSFPTVYGFIKDNDSARPKIRQFCIVSFLDVEDLTSGIVLGLEKEFVSSETCEKDKSSSAAFERSKGVATERRSRGAAQ